MEDLKKSGLISDPLNCVYEITQIYNFFKKIALINLSLDTVSDLPLFSFTFIYERHLSLIQKLS